MATILPAWVVIDSVTGVLTITAPVVSVDTEYYFYIISAIGGVSSSVQKLIKITVLNWVASNWLKWISNSISVWKIWSSGYILSSGVWNINSSTSSSSTTTSSGGLQNSTSASETAQALSKTSTSIAAATAGCIVLASLLNTSSIANLWLTINQLQIFFDKINFLLWLSLYKHLE